MKFLRIIPTLVVVLSFVWPAGVSGAAQKEEPGYVRELTEADSLAIAAADSIMNSISLDEVVVTAPLKEMEVRGDTTIFNADAYRLRDGAYLQELVRVIPGMEYDKASGRLTYYGTLLNEVMVNGEKFFGSDVVAALENLSVELISQLKVYDKASDQEEFTGVRTGGKNQVLDIQTKSAFDGMLMAGASVALGNENRYEGRLHGNSFRMGGDNFSFNADTGNSHILSGRRGNRQDSMHGSINKTFGKGIGVYLMGSYNHSINDDDRTSYRESYMLSGNRYSYNVGDDRWRRHGFSLNGTVNGKINDKTYLSLQGSVNNSDSRSSAGQRTAVFNTNPELDIGAPFDGPAYDAVPVADRVNDDRSSSVSKNRSRNYSASLGISRRLNDAGSTLSFSISAGCGRSRNEAFSLSEIRYYQLLTATGADSVLLRNQYNRTPDSSRQFSAGLSFSQTFGQKFSLNAGYSYVVSRESSERSTYDLSPFMDALPDRADTALPPGYLQGYVDSLSNHSFSHTIGHQISVSLNYGNDHWRVNGGISVTPERRTLDQKTGLISGDTVRSSVSFMPMLNVSLYRDKFSLDFNYSGSTNQPQLSSLMSMTDNSNPLYITHGNPSLKASYRQDFRLSARLNKFNLAADLSYSNVYDEQTQAVFYNPETGVSEVCPVNVNGNWSASANLWLSHSIKKFRLLSRIGGSYSHQVALLNEGQSVAPEKSLTLGRSCNSRIDVMYMAANITLIADFGWRFSNPVNRLRGSRSYMRDYDMGLNGNIRFLKRFDAGGRVRYTLRNSSIAASGNDEQTILDLNCSWSFLKNDAMKLAFEWNDILNRKKSISRGASPNGVYEYRSHIIGRYFLFTLSYDFRHTR